MAHTFDADRADRLEDPGRYRYCSRDELLSLLDPAPAAAVLEVGSGTGFYTRDVAPAVGTLFAVDIQPAMHEQFSTYGVPDAVVRLTATADALPFRTSTLEGTFTTMTYHEIATEAALEELHRVLEDGGRLVVVDWSKAGEGADGPPTEDRLTADTAADQLRQTGFTVADRSERVETFTLVATA